MLRTVIAKKRLEDAADLAGGAARFRYTLSCGHHVVGDYRRRDGLVLVHPKKMKCAQCAGGRA